MIQTIYSATERDHRSAMYLHLKPRPLYAVLGTIILVLMFAAIGHSLFVLKRFDKSIIFLVAGLSYFALYFFAFVPWWIRKTFRQNQFLQHKTVLTIDPSGVHTKSDIGNADIPWNHFIKSKSNDRVLLLYPTDAQFLLFPKTGFSNDQWQGFIDLVKANVLKNR